MFLFSISVAFAECWVVMFCFPAGLTNLLTILLSTLFSTQDKFLFFVLFSFFFFAVVNFCYQNDWKKTTIWHVSWVWLCDRLINLSSWSRWVFKSELNGKTLSSPGRLFWLDGSQITFSNWVNSPKPEAACGHILGDSGFQWEATTDCNKKLQFICQFGLSLTCLFLFQAYSIS